MIERVLNYTATYARKYGSN